MIVWMEEKKNKKILHVGPVFANRSSGPSNSILGIAKGMVLNGCEIGLLPSEPPGISRELIPADITLLPSPQKRHLNPWVISKKWIEMIYEYFGRPDVVNFHDTYIPFQTALASQCHKEKLPYVITPRGGLTKLAQKIKYQKKTIANLLFFNRFLENAHKVHLLTENEAADYCVLFSNKQTFIVPNGIDEEIFATASKLQKKKLNIFPDRNDHIVLGFVGRIDVYHKGIDLLLRGIKIAQERRVAGKILLIMVGPFYTNNDEKQIKKMIRELKFPDKVTLTGPTYGEKKWDLLNFCDVFVHTSRFEGMPMAVLEAMAFGKPCLVTPGSNLDTIISDCNGGWLCEENPYAISEALIKIEQEKHHIVQRGENARKYAKEHLTWNKIARQWLYNLNDITAMPDRNE